MAKDMQPAVRQPLGFWAARAGEAVAARTRGRLGELGMTQAQWWVLHQLSLHPTGRSDAEIVAVIGPNESDAAIEQAIAEATVAGWIERSGGRVALTDDGWAGFRAAADLQRELDDERRAGISDADFATTIEVLQRTLANLGSKAWHW